MHEPPKGQCKQLFRGTAESSFGRFYCVKGGSLAGEIL